MAVGKNYLISFLTTIKGHRAVRNALQGIQTQTTKTTTATKAMGQGFNKALQLAGRSALIIPIWFAMRTAFMAVVQTIQMLVKGMVDLDEGMARIKTVVSASSDSVERDMTNIRNSILKMSIDSRASIQELSEAFYFLRTANLSTKETMAAFIPTMNAMIGTGNTAKETARAVAEIYNTMEKTLGKNLTTTEKFTKIADILTFTYACYTPDTEVLTDKGWKYFKDLDKTEKVATLNPKTNEIEYQKPREYIIQNFEGQLYHLKGRFVDIKVTPTHKLYTQVGYRPIKKEYVLTEAKEVFGRPKTFYRGSKWQGKEPEYFILPEIKQQKHGKKVNKNIKIPMKLWLKFLGWYLSEGCCMYREAKDPTYNITIYQSRESKYWNKLAEVMKAMPYHVSEFNRGFVIHDKQLCSYLKQFGKSYEKYIPDFIKNLSKNLLRLFINTYAYGDGSFRGKSSGFVILTSSEKMKNDFHEIALKADYGSTYCSKKGTKKIINGVKTESKDSWSISFSDRTEILMYQKKNEYYARLENRKCNSVEKWIDYKGLVFCVEVPKYNTLFVRRNGKSFWCGNTQDVQLSELVEGYRKLGPYTTGLSDSFSDLSALLGFLNTNMLRAGRAGRLTGRTILQLTKNADKLASIFGVTFDPDQPINLIGTIRKLRDAIGQTSKITARQSEALRQVFATRGQITPRLAIANFEALEEAIIATREGADGFAKKMRDIKMDTVTGQFQRFKNILIVNNEAFLTAIFGTDGFKDALTKLNNTMAKGGLIAGGFATDIRTLAHNMQLLSKVAMPSFTTDWMAAEQEVTRLSDSWVEVTRRIGIFRREMLKAGLSAKDMLALPEYKKLSKQLKIVTKELGEAEKKFSALTAKGANEELQKWANNYLRIQEDVSVRLSEQKELHTDITVQKQKQVDLDNRQKERFDLLTKRLEIMGVNEKERALLKLNYIKSLEREGKLQQNSLQLLKAQYAVLVAQETQKRKEEQIAASLFLRYEKADAFEKRRLRRLGELQKLQPVALVNTYTEGGLDKKIILEFWDSFSVSGQNALREWGERASGMKFLKPEKTPFKQVAEDLKELPLPTQNVDLYWNYWLEKAQTSLNKFSGLNFPALEGGAMSVPKDISKLSVSKETTKSLTPSSLVTIENGVGALNVILPNDILNRVASEVASEVEKAFLANEELQKKLSKVLRPHI